MPRYEVPTIRQMFNKVIPTPNNPVFANPKKFREIFLIGRNIPFCAFVLPLYRPCSDKQYIQAIFQLYADKNCRDEGFSPFPDIIEMKIELNKNFEGNLVETIYEKAKDLEIFSKAEII